MAEIIGILTCIAKPALEIGNCFAAPIKRQFTYLCCFDDNIQSLREEAQRLKDAKDELQMRVDVAGRNAQMVLPPVKTWLESANQKMDIINGIENDIPLVQNGHLNMFKRYSVSRRAKETADSLRDLRNCGHFEQISQDTLPASMESIPNYGQMLAFESRKKMEEDIMEALKDRNVNTIGICGIGGVGKTTMAKRIMNRVRDEKLFVDVVLVAVGQQVNQHGIQRELAESLRMNLQDESLTTRAHKLRTRLSDTQKGSLIVLDDIWERLALDVLGIPCNSVDAVKCKVLLTSRNRDVLNGMEETDKIVGVPVLTQKEAWLLFREKVGECVDRPDLHSVAEDVAKECNYLPVALVTVGLALKNKTSLLIWDDALEQLRSSQPLHIPFVIRDVYMPLKLSYDKLETRHEKFLFLLCSMFKEDSNIDLEILTWYGMGLHMFRGTKSLKGARNRTVALVDMLKSRSLLLDGDGEGSVKMHDVIRDVARYISLDEDFMINLDEMSMNWPTTGNRFLGHTWIAMIVGNETDGQISMGLQFSNLRLLLMKKREGLSFDEPLNIPDSFFHGMEKINMLALEDIWIELLPASMQQLKNLQTLHLSNCAISESIVVLSELLTLEIFSCRNCDKIEAVPTEFARLNRLKVFEIVECRCLKTIAPGVISSFVRLEELKLIRSFNEWEGKQNATNTNAALEELESLSYLTCLEIEIGNYRLVSEEISLPPNIVKYDISIGMELFVHQFLNHLSMWMPEEVNFGNWIVKLLRSSENLLLFGDVSNKVNFLELESVKSLCISERKTGPKLLKPIGHSSGFDILPMLEELRLMHLDTLEEIFDGTLLQGEPVNVSLHRLTFVEILGCGKLRNLFPVSVARTLSQLATLRVWDCPAMEVVFGCDNNVIEDGKSSHALVHLSFPKLKTLSLARVPRLKDMCKGVQSIEMPELTSINRIEAPKFTSLISTAGPSTPGPSSHGFFERQGGGYWWQA